MQAREREPGETRTAAPSPSSFGAAVRVHPHSNSDLARPWYAIQGRGHVPAAVWGRQ